jgi:molybdopterin synthase sulfur carrier subunit
MASGEVTVRLPGVLSELAGGEKTVALAVPPAATVADVLDALAQRHPAVVRRIRDERGEVRRHVHVYLGDEDVRTTGGTATGVAPGAELLVVPAVSGG